ncbi:MAG TPA: DUF1499 domain-containing protein [Hyphomicrobiaceae bacterium]|nr:DUF1499 domain-containing protein [Hyphomicrobiaceae bacterium]
MTGSTPATFSRWTPRLGLFGGALLVSAVLLHRLFGMSTPIALNLLKVAAAAACLTVLMGVLALTDIWRRGRSGLAATLVGLAIALVTLGWPLAFLPAFINLPPLNDVSTDLEAPPRFVALAKARTSEGNGPDFPKERFARLQMSAYPDLKPLLVNRSSEEAFQIALDAVKRLKFQLVAEQPPELKPMPRPGWIEAVDRTLVFGFYDDVVVRVDGDQRRARIDVRSASRYGQHDLGSNADRTRRILKEILTRLEETVPAANARMERLVRGRAAVAKRLKEAGQRTGSRGTSQDRGQSDARRGPAPTGKQP